eukprot:12233702-Alexandrium_andersonii.AAC.1
MDGFLLRTSSACWVSLEPSTVSAGRAAIVLALKCGVWHSHHLPLRGRRLRLRAAAARGRWPNEHCPVTALLAPVGPVLKDPTAA